MTFGDRVIASDCVVATDDVLATDCVLATDYVVATDDVVATKGRNLVLGGLRSLRTVDRGAPIPPGPFHLAIHPARSARSARNCAIPSAAKIGSEHWRAVQTKAAARFKVG